VKSGDGWLAVKTGTSLKTGDELKISENAYLGLVPLQRKTHLRSNKPAVTRVADLAAKSEWRTSVLNKYTDFILSSNSAESKEKQIECKPGQVHRGGPEDITVFYRRTNISSIYNKHGDYQLGCQRNRPVCGDIEKYV